MNEIAVRNAETLSTLSVAFCVINGLGEVDGELAQAICLAINSALNEWYVNNDKVFNPATELIEKEALKYAFGEVQKIAVLAKMVAIAGM